MPAPTTPDERWSEFLAGRIDGLQQIQRLFRHLPHAPRCKLCGAPFAGVGSRVMGAVGFRRWPANPSLCSVCANGLDKEVGGTEVEATFLFADIRGSTAVAETMRPTAYRDLLERFYQVAAMAVDDAGGVIDKFLGDGVVAFFVPVFSGDGGPAGSAIRAARRLLAATGHGATASPWLPVGVGVHTGLTYVGVVGTPGGQLDFTGLGDVVNIAARLGSVAAAGEALVSTESARLGNLETAGLEHRTLQLKGRSEPVDVVVLGAVLPA